MPKNKNIVVYTCITGFYDDLLPPREIESGIDYICLTDQSTLHIAGWKMQLIPPEFGQFALANRFAKMHPHLVFPEYEISVYIDGNIEIISELRLLVRQALVNQDIALYEHPFRDCVYEEARECAAIGHDWHWTIKKQMKIYKQNNFPVGHGMFECNVIFRRHNSPAVRSLMEAWWDEFTNGVKRDQLSFTYLAWKLGVVIQGLGKSDQRLSRRNFSLSIGHRFNINRFNQMRGFINRKILRYFSWN